MQMGANNMAKGSHDPSNPFVYSQLNISVLNTMMNTDRRIEMGIIGQRQRRRFNQMRRLGVKIPKSYKRIFSARCLPKLIQEELVKYPETITDDSDYESDSACRQKYTDDPLKYIISSDEKKRTAIEQNAEPRRIHEARTKRGDLNFDIVKKLQNDAVHFSLES